MQTAAAVISDGRLDGEGKDVAKFPFVQLWPSIVTSRQRSRPAMPAIFIISVVSFSGFPGVHSYRDPKQIHKFNSLFCSEQCGRVIEPYLAVDQVACIN